MKTFEQLMRKRYNTKRINDSNRFDFNGNKINFLLSFDEYLNIFLPYKEDHRLYLNGNDPDRLCLCRVGDLGNYVIGNVYVDTKSNNNRFQQYVNPINKDKLSQWMIKNPEEMKIRALKANEASVEKNPHGTFGGRNHSISSINLMKQKHKINNHQKGEANSQYGSYWITNGIMSIKWNDSKGEWPKGYRKGRVCK